MAKTGMDPRIKANWLEALRSGRYTQGHGVLRGGLGGGDSNAFCCLGVLCDLAVETGLVKWNEASWQEPGGEPVYTYSCEDPKTGDAASGILPACVQEWAGVSRDSMTALWKLNDIQKLSFDRIADIIEEEF